MLSLPFVLAGCVRSCDADATTASRGERIRAYIAIMLLSAVNLVIAAVRIALWPRRRPRDVRRIGIYRIGNIGDVVCALPAMHAIRRTYPKAHLTLVTSPGRKGAPGAQELLGDADWIDELIVYYRDGETGALDLIKQIRKARFDLWIVLPPSPGTLRRRLRDMLMARIAGVRWSYGWRLDYLKLWGSAQSRLFVFPNETEWLMSLVRKAGFIASDFVFHLPLTAAPSAFNSLIESSGRPLVAIAPGAKRPTNRWPIERFASVAAALAEKGFRVAVLGSAADAEACAQLAAVVKGQCINFAGRTSLLESCEVLRRCRLVIANDSGVQHLAAAVGTPCLSIFSFRDFRGRWYPHGAKNVVLQKWLPCASCLLEVCPYENRCIRAIEIDEVVQTALRMLDPVGDRYELENRDSKLTATSGL